MWIETKAVFFVLTMFGVTPTGEPSVHATLFTSMEHCQAVGRQASKLAEEQEWGYAFFICVETPEVTVRETHS